jgi:hypothetical protein
MDIDVSLVARQNAVRAVFAHGRRSSCVAAGVSISAKIARNDGINSAGKAAFPPYLLNLF